MRWRSSIIRGATVSASRSMRASRAPAGVAARAADAKAVTTVAREAVLQRGMSSSTTRKQTATRPSPVRGAHENLPILYPEGEFLIPGGQDPSSPLGLKPQAEQSPPLQGCPPPSSPGWREGDGTRGPG